MYVQNTRGHAWIEAIGVAGQVHHSLDIYIIGPGEKKIDI